MKLTIRRSQSAKTGLFGGHKGMLFSLFCKVQISAEEQELINRYKVSDCVLVWRKGPDGTRAPLLTVGNLTHGYSQEVDSVDTLLKKECEIRDACQSFLDLLEVMASFGGEEVVEILPRKRAAEGSSEMESLP